MSDGAITMDKKDEPLAASQQHGKAMGAETVTVAPELADATEKPYVFAHSYDVDPFAAQAEAKDGDYLEFRTMSWWSAGIVGTAEAIALGLLSFPSIFLRLGMVGGCIATFALAILAYLTCWIMVDFKCKHMGVMNYGDAGGVLFGVWGRRFIGLGVVLKSMGLAGSHVLVGQKALNTLSTHAICGVWFGLVITIASVIMSYNREWGKLHLMSAISVSCILVSAMITMIGTGVQSDSVLMKKGVPIEWHATPQDPTLVSILGGITNVVFAYGGSIACFTLCSEMRKPEDFKKSFALVQGSQAVCYVIVGAVVYSFGGQYTVSPALTMTTHTVSIIAYSFALVTIMVSGILGANVGTKYLYMTWLRNSPLLTSRGYRAWLAWMGMVGLMWTVGFIVSQLIPFFNELLTVISSVFSVWFIYGYVGFMWFYDNHPWLAKYANDPNPRAVDTLMKKVLMAVSIISIVFSVAITPLGLYSAAMGIKTGYSQGSYKHPFSC